MDKSKFYWLIRGCYNNEAFGIYAGEYSNPILYGAHYGAIVHLLELIGHDDWWYDFISKTEYETYKEFGFKVWE